MSSPAPTPSDPQTLSGEASPLAVAAPALPVIGEAERYRLLVEGVTDYAIYMLDPVGTVTSWNAGAQRLKGYDAAEIVGRNFELFYEPADRATRLPARLLEIARTEGVARAEGWRVRKDGTRFWALVVIDPIRDPAGGLLGYAKITRDLSERRAIEEALRESEQRFRLLVDGVVDYALYTLDPDGRVSTWNAGAQRIKGYAAAEIVGQHFSRFHTEEDRARGEPQRSLAIAAREGRYETEAWRVRSDGTRFWANVVIDAIRDPSGTLLGFAKITRDITERRDAQLALERTREALHQSQKLEAIGKLTGGVAHDFNNLLTVILSSLELLRLRLPDAEPRVQRLIDNAMQGAQRGATLTQRMLAYARRQALEPRPVALASLVTGMRDLLQGALGPQVAIETRFPPDLLEVMADPHQLETAVLNLAVNARDAMPNGGALVIAASRLVVEPPDAPSPLSDPLPAGAYVSLTVADTGEGMDAATLARATEPFFTTKGVGKGTGLGLSMVHGMMEQLGGRLRLASRAGAGTTVELVLPVAAGAAGADAAAEPAARPSRPLRVMVVDDDMLVLANAVALLEDLGHHVVPASGPDEALRHLDGDAAIDIVVTDYAMPVMNGVDLAAAIAARRPGLPVLLATGYAELPGTGPALPRLDKPYRQSDLAAAIAAAVG